MSNRHPLVQALMLLAMAACPALAQETSGSNAFTAPPGSLAENMDLGLRTSSVEVHLQVAGGAVLPVDAHVSLFPVGNGIDSVGQNITNVFQKGIYQETAHRGVATLGSVEGGEYLLEVSASGYQTHRERLTVVPGYAHTRAFVKLHVFDGSSDDIELEQAGAPVINATARRYVELAALAIKQSKYKDAASQLQRAIKAAPQNPDVHFMAGYVSDLSNDSAGARQQFETAIQLFPNHFAAQLALGQSLLLAKDPQAAIPHFEKALAVGPNSWRGHWMLAEACLQGPRDTERARSEAQRAVEVGKDRATRALVTVAMADALAGQRDAAHTELEAFLHNYPSSPDADRAKQMLSQLDAAGSAAAVPLTANAVAVDPDDLESVAPEDVPGLPVSVDPAVPAVSEGVTCDLPQVLAGAAARSEELTENLERFTAKELVVHALLDAKGVPKNSRQRSFDYVVSLDRTPADFIRIDEMRDSRSSLDNFPAQFAVEGIPALGIVFHPKMSGDFKFACEGLGQRLGQPAWQVRFEQRTDRPARLHSWVVEGKEYPAMLKGRAWLSSGSYQLLHVDVELAEPIRPLRLEYQHMSVDYKPVNFPSKQKALWLPTNVVVFCKLKGHYFRQEHDFSDFTLFSTGVEEKVGAPKH